MTIFSVWVIVLTNIKKKSMIERCLYLNTHFFNDFTQLLPKILTGFSDFEIVHHHILTVAVYQYTEMHPLPDITVIKLMCDQKLSRKNYEFQNNIKSKLS